MFINLSNHTSENWGEFQKKEAIKYGDIIDMPFPAISPYLSSEELDVSKWILRKGEKIQFSSCYVARWIYLYI